MAQRTNYVLIDFESVQPDALDVLNHEHFKLFVFLGAKQPKLPTKIVTTIQRLGSRAEYVEIAGSGPNALDFHIAFYVGQLSVADPKAYFHIVSKDKGFDPLIEHLKARHILCGRVTSIQDIPLVKAAGPLSREQKLELIVTQFKQPRTTRPRTVKTLGNFISTLFKQQLADTEIALLIQGLSKLGFLSIDGTKVSYALPE